MMMKRSKSVGTTIAGQDPADSSSSQSQVKIRSASATDRRSQVKIRSASDLRASQHMAILKGYDCDNRFVPPKIDVVFHLTFSRKVRCRKDRSFTPIKVATLNSRYVDVMILYLITSPIPSIRDWSCADIIKYVDSEEADQQVLCWA